MPLFRRSCVLVVGVLSACVTALDARSESVTFSTLGFQVTQSQPGTRLMIHVVPGNVTADSSFVCSASVPGDCVEGSANHVTEAPLSSPEVPYYFAYVIATGYDTDAGFTGVQFGIEYDGAPMSGIDILDWTSCSVLQFSSNDWPASGSGNMCTWFPDHPSAPEPCQRSGTTVVGYFTITVWSPDVLNLTPRPVDGALKVADCSRGETLLPDGAAGAAGFGGSAGEDPCTMPPTPLPAPPPSVSIASGTQLILHAVPAELVTEDLCLTSPYDCTDRDGSFTTQVPVSSQGNQEYIVYFILKTQDDYIQGTTFQIEYSPGIEVLEWSPCNYHSQLGTEHLSSPPSGTTITVAFTRNCRTFFSDIHGSFRIRANSSGRFELKEARVGRCPSQRTGYEWTSSNIVTGRIGFGDQPGRNGCTGLEDGQNFVFPLNPATTPVSRTTWSGIKTRYSDSVSGD